MTPMRSLIFVLIAAPASGLLSISDAHQARTHWTYPPACCNGSDVGGDCESIPSRTVRKDRYGFTVILHPGDHHLVTTEHRFLIPYGSELPSGDSEFHICLYPNQYHVNCFFAPPEGA